MGNKKINKFNGKMVITFLLLLIVILGGTFAWFTYRSKETALVLSIGDINDSRIIINPYEIRDSLTPVNIYTSGVYSQVEVINNSSSEMEFQLFYRINNLDDEIIDSGLKYTIVSSDVIDGVYEEVKTGDFLSIGEENEYVIYDDVVSSSTTIYYKVYVWLDSSVGNQSVIGKMELDIELNASGTIIINTSPVNSYSCANASAGSSPYLFTYTGNCEVIDDGGGDWRVKFLTTGTLTSTADLMIDAFLVGGGGGGAKGSEESYAGGGGGGGYGTTITEITLSSSNEYEITIGAGGSAGGGNGETTTAFNSSASGGTGASKRTAGTGGNSGGNGGKGGYGNESAGSNGSSGNISTREFGESTGTMYAGGGGGGGGGSYSGGSGGSGGGGNGGSSTNYNGTAGTANTGGGGGGGTEYYGRGSGSAGGSGIVIIRNKR